MQKGPWSRKGSQITDTSGNVIQLIGVGLAMRMVGGGPDDKDAYENTELLAVAPTQNHLIGKVLDVANNPYSTDAERVQELYDLVIALDNVYISNENYEE